MLFAGRHEVGSSQSHRAAWLVLGLALACLPVASAGFLPITDLPQHVAQIRLLEELWGLAPSTVDLTALIARPLAPNSLVYVPMFLLARVLPVVLAGKLTIVLILCGSVVALHALAARRSRDPLHALVAGCLLFNVSLYWGFLNFLIGLPFFLLFVGSALSPAPFDLRSRRLVIQTVLVLLMVWAHVFWVACAGLVMAISVARGEPRRRLGFHLLTLLPATAVLAVWYPSIIALRQSTGVQMQARYLIPIGERFRLDWWASTMFGGIAGPLEPTAVFVVLGYLGWAVLLVVRRRSLDLDRGLLTLGGLFALFSLLAPDLFFNTMMFGRRFLAYGAMFVLLALPAVASRWLRLLTSIAMTAFAVVTALTWALFDQVDVAGLRESLAAVDKPKSVLGLDYHPSRRFRNRATMHLYAYFQARHGGQLNFSFAEHGSSVVSYRKPRSLAWTPTLDWYPKRATVDDVDAFDCVLISADPPTHARLDVHPGLDPLVRDGFVRIYCHDAPRPD